MPRKPYEFRPVPERRALALAGGVCSASAEAFSDELFREALRLQVASEPGEVIHLILDDLDLLDGTAVAEVVNAVRRILGEGWHVRIERAPQMLAHTLYKSGLLKDGRITLVDPVEEESTAN